MCAWIGIGDSHLNSQLMIEFPINVTQAKVLWIRIDFGCLLVYLALIAETSSSGNRNNDTFVPLDMCNLFVVPKATNCPAPCLNET